MRGLVERLLGGDDARRRQVALLLDDVLWIARQALDGRRADPVLDALGDLEDDIGLALLRRNLLGTRHRHVQIAMIAVDRRQLLAALRLLIERHGAVRKPTDWIPPRQVVNRLVQFGDVDEVFVELVGRPHRLPHRNIHRMLGAVENVVRDLLPRSLAHDERDVDVVSAERRRPIDDLCVRIVLLQVGETHFRGGGGEIGLAIEIAVLKPRLLGDLRLAELVIALDNQGGREAHLPLHKERHLNTCGGTLHVGVDFLKLARVLEGRDVTRHRHGIVRLARLRLAAAGDR